METKKQQHPSLKTEVRAGLVTFLTMAYILFVNPMILSKGIDIPNAHAQLLTATAFAAAFGSFVMGWLAKFPFALAPGMGLNAYFTYGVVLGAGVDWRVAMGTTFIASLLFLTISLTGFREAILNAIPPFIKSASAAGIGLFLAVIGLQNSGVMVADAATLTKFVSLADEKSVMVFVGVVLGAALLVRKVPGALLIALISVSVAAIVLQAPVYQGQAFAGFANGIIASPVWPSDLWLAFDWRAALDPKLFAIVLMFLFIDFFDTAGSLFGLASRSGLLDATGKLPRARQAFAADALATVFSAIVGVSPTTTFVESAAGIEEGGRTGTTAIVVGLCFLVSPILWPLASAIPPQAPAVVLILVGCMMTSQLTMIDWSDMRVAVPAFLTAIAIPCSFSIASGISLGVISFALIAILSGGGKKVHWIVYALAGVLMARYLLLPSVH